MLLHHQYNPSPLTPRRLVFEGPSRGDLAEFIAPAFEEKVEKNYEKQRDALAGEIETLEKKGKTEQEIRDELKNRQQEIARQAFDAALKDLNVTYKKDNQTLPVTYRELVDHDDTGIKKRAESIYEKFQQEYQEDVDKAVDQYVREKRATSGKTARALTALPAPTERIDLDAANPETARLQEILDKRQGILDKSRHERAALIEDEKVPYKGRTNLVDALTSPEGGMIDDYDDGIFGNQTDFTSYTRARLNGYLYASDIFTGGGEPGKKAVEEAIKKPYELFSAWHGSRLDMDDLEGGMQLKSYFDQVKPFTTYDEKSDLRFDRAIGTMAGLLKMTDDLIKDKKTHDAYQAYLLGEFAKINTVADLKNNEERQIEFLYTLQSFAEFINANSQWRVDFDRIEQFTDPDRKGDDAIDDYPDDGWFNIIGEDRNRINNPVREGLNGYLYAVHIFSGGNEQKVKEEYKRAFIMYEDVAGDMFLQEHLDRESRGPDGDDDGFGLGKFTKEAETYSENPTVKYAIAGLLKFTDEIGNEEERKHYRIYLEERLKSIKKDDSKEAQLTILSTIRSPEKAAQELKYMMHARLMQATIEATRQHNQYKLDQKLVTALEGDPEKMTVDQLEQLAQGIKSGLDKFIVDRSNAALGDMQKKFNLLQQNNSGLKEQVYNSTEISDLRQRIEENAKLFGKAKGIQKESSLANSVSMKFLEDLSAAEKEYYDLAADLDAKLATLNERAKANIPDQTPPELPKTKEVITEPESFGDDIEANWAAAPRETSELGEFTGSLIAYSGDPNDLTQIRNSRGKLLGRLDEGETVERSSADARIQGRNVLGIVFIRIHWQGKIVWAPQAQLFKNDAF